MKPKQTDKKHQLKIYNMRKQILAAMAISVLFMVACTKSTTKTEQVENPDGSVTTTTTTVTETSAHVDTSKINKAKEDVKVKVDEAGNKIDNAAQKTKENLNEAGKDIKQGAQEIGKDVKDAAAKGAAKVEEGAKKLKEDLNK